MQLKIKIFKNFKDIRIDSPIKDHIGWLHTHVLSKPYKHQKVKNGIARPVHGTADMARTALFAKPVLEYYRRHGDKQALEITPEQLHVLEILITWHDSGREDDGEDESEIDNAINCYHYFHITLGLSHEEAKFYAEVILNKDASPGKFIELILDGEERISFQKSSRKEKNIFEKVLHDADCFDIIRARGIFDGSYLDMVKQFVDNAPNELVADTNLAEIAQLRKTMSSIIELSGDGWGRMNFDIKTKFESIEAYTLFEDLLTNYDHLKIFSILYNDNELIPLSKLPSIQILNPISCDFDKDKNDSSEDSFRRYMEAGHLLTRGIPTPSCWVKKIKKNNERESVAELDLRKTFRQEGNSARSTSIIGDGGAFSSAGWLIKLRNHSSVQAVYDRDVGTGFGKNKTLHNLFPALTIEIQYKNLVRKLKRGGHGRLIEQYEYADVHSEVLVNIFEIDGIYFTHDPVHMNCATLKNNGLAKHKNSPPLEAIYLQQTYFKATGITLPIFEYSRIHGFLRERQYSEEEIITFWREACVSYIQTELASSKGDVVSLLSIEDIKILAIYGVRQNYCKIYHDIYGDMTSVDNLYPRDLQNTINNTIAKEKEQLILRYQEKMREKLINGGLKILSVETLKFLATGPQLTIEIKELIKRECIKAHKTQETGLIIPYFLLTIQNFLTSTPLFTIIKPGQRDIIFCLADGDVYGHLFGGANYDYSLTDLLLQNTQCITYLLAKQCNFTDIIDEIESALIILIKKIFNEIELKKNSRELNKEERLDELLGLYASIRIVINLVLNNNLDLKIQIDERLLKLKEKLIHRQCHSFNLKIVNALHDMKLLKKSDMEKIIKTSAIGHDDVFDMIEHAKTYHIKDRLAIDMINRIFRDENTGKYKILFTYFKDYLNLISYMQKYNLLLNEEFLIALFKPNLISNLPLKDRIRKCFIIKKSIEPLYTKENWQEKQNLLLRSFTQAFSEFLVDDLALISTELTPNNTNYFDAIEKLVEKLNGCIFFYKILTEDINKDASSSLSSEVLNLLINLMNQLLSAYRPIVSSLSDQKDILYSKKIYNPKLIKKAESVVSQLKQETGSSMKLASTIGLFAMPSSIKNAEKESTSPRFVKKLIYENSSHLRNNRLFIAQDQNYLLVKTSHILSIFNLETLSRNEVIKIDRKEEFYDITISNNGQFIAAIIYNKTHSSFVLTIWQYFNEKINEIFSQNFFYDPDIPLAICFDNHNNQLLFAMQNQIQIIDLVTQKINIHKFDLPITAISDSPDHESIIFCCKNKILTLNRKTFECISQVAFEEDLFFISMVEKNIALAKSHDSSHPNIVIDIQSGKRLAYPGDIYFCSSFDKKMLLIELNEQGKKITAICEMNTKNILHSVTIPARTEQVAAFDKDNNIFFIVDDSLYVQKFQNIDQELECKSSMG